jgi:hypothetical protein
LIGNEYCGKVLPWAFIEELLIVSVLMTSNVMVSAF